MKNVQAFGMQIRRLPESILVGPSRKGMLGAITFAEIVNRI
jgi:hypothetical protein